MRETRRHLRDVGFYECEAQDCVWGGGGGTTSADRGQAPLMILQKMQDATWVEIVDMGTGEKHGNVTHVGRVLSRKVTIIATILFAMPCDGR